LGIIAGLVTWVVILIHQLIKSVKDLKRKLYSAEHDIKTLHLNQKVLQLLVKEIRRDLIVYGEIKKSRHKALSGERQEETGEAKIPRTF
jgi:hypothetical protein